MKSPKENLSAVEWLAKLNGRRELTYAEKAALTDFLRESPTNVRELIEQTFIRQDLKTLPIPPAQLDKWIAAARSSVAGASPFPEKQEICAHPGKICRAGLGLRLLVSASLTAVLATAGVFLYSQIGLYTTAFGEQRILTLADGSVVTLNSQSQIKVDFSDKNRLIEFRKGEAFFRVAHDTTRPFLVDANGVTVRAVGTMFNVRIAPQDTVVSVVGGVVKVSLNTDWSAALVAAERAQGSGRQVPPDESPVTLSKGQEARIQRPGLRSGSAQSSIRKAETPAGLHAAAWVQGRLEFEESPLAQVLAEFQRYQRFDFEIDNETTGQLKLTGSFETHDPDSVFAYIATIKGIAVEKRGPHSYFIRRR